MASIKDCVSIVTIYNTLMGTNHSLSASRRNNVKCPFHDDAKASAHFYLDTNTLYCFSCKKHWSPVKFVQELKGCTVEDAKKLCCAIGGIDYNPPKPVSEQEKVFYDIYSYVAGLFNFLYKDDYFEKRGFSPELIKEYQLGFCPVLFDVKFNDKPVTLRDILIHQFPEIPPKILDSLRLYDFKGVSVYADRYTFPIKDKYGRVVGFTARAKGDAEPKYYNTPSIDGLFNKKSLLYNYDVAMQYPNIYVVEGTCDALSLIQAGINNVVAPLGTSFTDEHLKMLSGKQLILAFDNDKAGLNTMYKLIINNPTNKFMVYILKGYKDFNEALQKGADLVELVRLKKAMGGIDFVIYAHRTNYDLNNLACRKSLCFVVEQLLTKGHYHWVEDDYYRKHLVRLFKGYKNGH